MKTADMLESLHTRCLERPAEVHQANEMIMAALEAHLQTTPLDGMPEHSPACPKCRQLLLSFK